MVMIDKDKSKSAGNYAMGTVAIGSVSYEIYLKINMLPVQKCANTFKIIFQFNC